jgi:hypothetical protein
MKKGLVRVYDEIAGNQKPSSQNLKVIPVL